MYHSLSVNDLTKKYGECYNNGAKRVKRFFDYKLLTFGNEIKLGDELVFTPANITAVKYIRAITL